MSQSKKKLNGQWWICWKVEFFHSPIFNSAWPDFLSLTLGQLCAFEAKNEIGESKVSPAVSERFIVRKLAPRLSPNGTVSGSSGHPSPLSLSLSDDVTQPILLSHSFLMFLFLCFSLEGLDAPDAVGVRRILLHHAVLHHSTVIWRKKIRSVQDQKRELCFYLTVPLILWKQCSCLRVLPVPKGVVWSEAVRGVRGGVGTLCLSACVLPFLSLQHHDHCGPVKRACLWVRQ